MKKIRQSYIEPSHNPSSKSPNDRKAEQVAFEFDNETIQLFARLIANILYRERKQRMRTDSN